MCKQMRKLAVILYCCLLLHNASAGQEIHIIDDLGHTLTFDKPVQRIISLSPHLTELVFSAGAGDKLIGRSQHCDYPPAVNTILQVSNYQTINFEIIAALQADVVLVWNAGLKAAQLTTLSKVTPRIYFSKIDSFEHIAKNLTDIGLLAGTHAIAAAQAKHFLLKMTEIKQDYHTADPIPLIYLLWNDPPMTVNKRHWINQAISLCGGHNIYGESKNTIVTLNREAMLLSNAKLILHSSRKLKSQPSLFSHMARLPTIYINPDLLQRPSLRIIQGVESLCQKLANHL